MIKLTESDRSVLKSLRKDLEKMAENHCSCDVKDHPDGGEQVFVRCSHHELIEKIDSILKDVSYR